MMASNFSIQKATPVKPAATSRTVREAIEWAFHAEKASLDPVDASPAPQPSSYGMEYVMMQQAMLGCKVDRSGHVPEGHHTAPQAEYIAAMVGGLPDHLGGRRVALTVAECGRQRCTPDWMADAEPRLVPQEWAASNQHGRKGKSQIFGKARTMVNGRLRVTDVMFTPCRWVPSMSEIAFQRERYTEWREALAYLAGAFQDSGMLTFDIASDLPASAPWRKRR